MMSHRDRHVCLVHYIVFLVRKNLTGVLISPQDMEVKHSV